jgi:cytochrome c oxidase cbb3-type subunit 1
MAAFFLSSLMLVASSCPQNSRVTEFTWFGPAQSQLQILGFFLIITCGVIYELLPRVMGFGLPLAKWARMQQRLFIAGVILWVGSLAVGGLWQGMKLQNASLPFADSTGVALIFLRIGTTGLLLLLAGSLIFAANIFVMTFDWKMALLKTMVSAVKAPLESVSSSGSTRRGEGGEVNS